MTYWDLVEMLYENNGKLILSECDSYAFALRTECELILNLVHNFDVFQVSECGTFFYSNGVNKRIELRAEKSSKAQKSANLRWQKANEKKEVNANAMRTHSEGNAIKENKSKLNIKESKVNIYVEEAENPPHTPVNSKTFSKPTIEECIDHFSEKMAVGWNVSFAENQGERFWHFYESKGWMVGKNKMKSWHSAVSTWIKNTTKTDEQKFLNKGQNNATANSYGQAKSNPSYGTKEEHADIARRWADKLASAARKDD